MSAAIAAHQASGYPGEYTLTESGGILHVVPVATKGREGQGRVTSPLMGESFALSVDQGAKVGPVIRAALRAAGAVGNRKIVLGSFLPQQFEEIALPSEPNPLSARDWISKALAAGGVKMSWLLLYDPTFDYYALTLYPI